MRLFLGKDLSRTHLASALILFKYWRGPEGGHLFQFFPSYRDIPRDSKPISVFYIQLREACKETLRKYTTCYWLCFSWDMKTYIFIRFLSSILKIRKSYGEFRQHELTNWRTRQNGIFYYRFKLFLRFLCIFRLFDSSKDAWGTYSYVCIEVKKTILIFSDSRLLYSFDKS